MAPDWFDQLSLPSLRMLLGVVLGTTVFGAGFVRYMQITDGGPILDVLFVYGLWGVGALLVVLASVPTALGYSAWYSYTIPLGVLFGAVSVIGVASVGTPPSQLVKFGYGLLFGFGSAAVLGTPAAVLGVLYRRVSRRDGGDG